MSEAVPPPSPTPPRKRLLPILFALAVTMLVGLALAHLVFRPPDLNQAKWRREWKDATISLLEKRVADAGWVTQELAAVKAKLAAEGEEDDGWFSSNLLLLKNGDWIAYASRCRKEDWRIPDIFIGRGSDGKWYYSTYHFCRGMLALRVDDRPESLTKFITSYSLREFDGHSDECLKKTWPIPEP